MTLDLALRWFTAAALIAIAIWELVQLARRPRDQALRVLVPGLICLAFAATVGIRRAQIVHPLKAALGTWWPSVINGCWMTMAFAFASYYLLVDTRRPYRVHQAMAELGILVAAIATMTILVQIAPEETAHKAYRTWQHALFYIVVDGYSLIIWGIGVRRAIRFFRLLENLWARAAFRLVITGTAAMAIGVDFVSLIQQIIRAVSPSVDIAILHTMYSAGQLIGQLLLALGLAFVPLATVVVQLRGRYDKRIQHYYSRKMKPLWKVLTTEFPHITLGHSDDFERMSTEITDGLSELARYCRRTDRYPRETTVAADLIEDGIESRKYDASAPCDPPYPRLEPDFSHWRDRARWMAELGQILQHRGWVCTDEYVTE